MDGTSCEIKHVRQTILQPLNLRYPRTHILYSLILSLALYQYIVNLYFYHLTIVTVVISI